MKRFFLTFLLLLATVPELLAEHVFDDSNYVYLTDGHVYIGSQYVLPISMKNNKEFVAYQMDLYLPSGLSVAMDGEQMAISGARMSASHVLESMVMADGAIRVVCYSNDNSPLTGNSGEIAYITLDCTVEDECELPIIIRNVRLAALDGNDDYVSEEEISCLLSFSHEFIPVSSITLNQTSFTGFPGDRFQLTATILPDNATDRGVVWSSSNENVATVSQSGLVEIKEVGEAVITVTTTDSSGLSASCTITANPILVSSITLDRTSISGSSGDRFQLTATVLPDNATDRGVVWSSSNENVATVSQSGLVTLIGGGYATVSAHTTDGSKLSAQCSVSCTTGNVSFADASVKSICVSNWDVNEDGELSFEEAALVTTLGDAFHNQAAITSFCELRHFIGLTSIPSGTFQGCDNLLALAWDRKEVSIPNDIMSHPNGLLYIASGVQSEYAGNTVVDGWADKITLAFGESLYIPEGFKAGYISCSREFTKTTYRGQSAGWEAMVLPYDVAHVMHETNGAIYPFEPNTESGGNNYWLGSLSNDGFVLSKGIKANVPFIVSMPNSTDYGEQYNMNGVVTFVGTNADVQSTETASAVNGPSFVLMPTYKPVEASDTVYPLNDTDYMAYHAGSAFVSNSRQVSPFECYVRPNDYAASPRFYVIGENATTAIRMMNEHDGLAHPSSSALYNVYGQPVDESYQGIVIRNGVKYVK